MAPAQQHKDLLATLAGAVAGWEETAVIHRVPSSVNVIHNRRALVAERLLLSPLQVWLLCVF